MIATDVLAANAAPISNQDGPSDGLGQQDFLAMLVAQLENQDPLNPQDGTEFTAQLAQFSSLEQLLNMRESIDALVAVQTESQSVDRSLENVDLIGKNVLFESNRLEIPEDYTQWPKLGFELSEPAEISSITLVDDMTSAEVGRFRPQGMSPAGITRLDWNDLQYQEGIPQPGTYRLRFDQPLDQSIARGLVETRVTGMATQGGVLYLGGLEATVDDLREVRP